MHINWSVKRDGDVRRKRRFVISGDNDVNAPPPSGSRWWWVLAIVMMGMSPYILTKRLQRKLYSIHLRSLMLLVKWCTVYITPTMRLRLLIVSLRLRHMIIAIAWTLIPVADAADTATVTSVTTSVSTYFYLALAQVGYWLLVTMITTVLLLVTAAWCCKPFRRGLASAVTLGDEFRLFRDDPTCTYPNINAPSPPNNGVARLLSFIERRDAECRAVLALLQGIGASATRLPNGVTHLMAFIAQRREREEQQPQQPHPDDTSPTPTLPDLNHISQSMASSPTRESVGNRTNRWPPRDLRHDVPTTAHITAEDLASARLDDDNGVARLVASARLDNDNGVARLMSFIENGESATTTTKALLSIRSF